MTATAVFSPPEMEGGSSSGLGSQARGLADDAKKSATTIAEDGKLKGAERLKGVADTADRVADEVADASPAMADWVHKAAHEIDGVSRNLKDKSVGELLEMGKGFARREPAAFIAASAVAGFALSRFLKSSSSAVTSRSAPADKPTSVPMTRNEPDSMPVTPGHAGDAPHSTGPIGAAGAAATPSTSAGGLAPIRPGSASDVSSGGKSAGPRNGEGDPSI